MVSSPTHEEISARAFQIYVASGYIEGRDLENWLQAEAELAHERQSGSGGGTSVAGIASRTGESQPSKVAAPVQGRTTPASAAKSPTKRGVRPKGASSKAL